MPEYVQEQTNPSNDDQQQEQHPSQPLEIQPDGTWILGKGANRWLPTKYQIGDMRWLVERDCAMNWASRQNMRRTQVESNLEPQNAEGIR